MKKWKLKELFKKITFELKCRKADSDYYTMKLFMFSDCFKLIDYFPSFFMKHTKEEAKEIMKREREKAIAEINKLLDEMED